MIPSMDGCKVKEVEVRLKGRGTAPKEVVKKAVRKMVSTSRLLLVDSCLAPEQYEGIELLREHVEAIRIVATHLDDKEKSLSVFAYELHHDEKRDILCMSEDGTCVGRSPAWAIPSTELEGLWESLVYAEGMKEQLLSYVSTAMLFSQRGVDPKLVGWNNIVLLHGPPGRWSPYR